MKYGNQIKLTPHSGCQWGKIILHADFLDQTIVEFVQALHEHFRLAEHRQEVRVTIPPRHDMPVEMAGKAKVLVESLHEFYDRLVEEIRVKDDCTPLAS